MALIKILEILLLIRSAITNRIDLDSSELQTILLLPHLNRHQFLSYIAESNHTWLDANACSKLLTEEESVTRASLTSFSERAETLSILAGIASVHSNTSMLRSLIRSTAENLLSHGYREMIWYEVIEAIRLLNQSAPNNNSLNFLLQIAAQVDNVREYTHGDEIELIEESYTRALAEISIPSLCARLAWLLNTEKWFRADETFVELIKRLDYNNVFDRALASTALEDSALAALREHSRFSPEALQILEAINERYKFSEPVSKQRINSNSEEDKSLSEYRMREENAVKDVLPNKLSKRLRQFKDSIEKRQFLEAWEPYWANKEPNNYAKFLYESVKDEDATELPANVLDTIARFLQHSDPDRAFDLLCHSQANGFGWSWYLRHSDPAIERWQFLKSTMPERRMEFILRSSRYGAQRSQRYQFSHDYFGFPLLLGIRFLLMFDEIDLCWSLVEHAMNFGIDLCKDLNLGQAPWVQKVVDSVDLLLLRLSDRGPFVQERAASALALLLSKPETKSELLPRITNLLTQTPLESKQHRALCVLLKAREIDSNCLTSGELDLLKAKFISPSLIVNMAFQQMNSVAINVSDSDEPQPIEYSNEHDEKLVGFLAKYNGNYSPLGLAYLYRQLGYSAFSEWITMTSYLVQRYGVHYHFGDYSGYRGRAYRHILMRMFPRLSDAYLTAHLRLMEIYKSSIPDDFLIDYTLKAFPVDTSYWRTQPGARPSNWPKLDIKLDSATKQALSSLDVEQLISNIRTCEGNTLLHLQGPITAPGDVLPKLSGLSLTVTAFAYRRLGNGAIDAERLFQALSAQRLVAAPTQLTHPFGFLDNSKVWLPGNEEEFFHSDVEVFPLVGRLETFVNGDWHWYREFNQPSCVTSRLIERPSVSILDGGWDYSDDQKSASFRDWISNLSERVPASIGADYGQYLSMDSFQLDDWLKLQGLRLGYVYELKLVSRKDEYQEKPSEIYSWGTFQVSNLVL